ncbi:MAG: ABC transporter ATP-binding protein [bacterium]|nr:ABC transporter ATP-binding protein [bacterium]
MADVIIRASALSKTYSVKEGRARKQVQALRSFDLEVKTGEMFGLIGPDGAGKTTFMRILCGLLLPDSGQVAVLGFDPVTQQHKIKQDIGYMPQRFSLYQDLTVEENLNFFTDIFQVPRQERSARTQRLLEFSRLGPFSKRRAGALSGGMKQKLALSCTLIHTPKLLILDEPTTGVDPVSRGEFWDILGELQQQGVTILVSTPYMDEAARCDRVALTYAGQILALGTPDQIAGQFPHQLVRIFTRQPYDVAAALRQLEILHSVELYGDHVTVALDDPVTVVEIIRKNLDKRGYSYTSIDSGQADLEDTFVYLMRQLSQATQPELGNDLDSHAK